MRAIVLILLLPGLAHADLVKDLYTAEDKTLLFYVDDRPTEAARALNAIIAQLADHGIDPGSFGLGFDLDAPKKIKTADRRLAKALIRYIRIFHFDRTTNPGGATPRPERFRKKHGSALISIASKILDDPSELVSLWPSSPQYARLITALKHHQMLAANAKRKERRAARRKVDAIRASLGRLRESIPLRKGLDTYIRVNIPSFSLTLYEGGKATRSHKVIVGNNRLEYDRTAWRQGFLNRTPLLATRLLEVVINPAWRPPPRILEEEFDGREDVVVPPGPRNPLGYAKFVLEKTNAVFLHDTNKRKLFTRDRRAFSHGCVRVHEAEKLARYVALEYGGLSDADYTLRRDTKDQHVVKLTKELPVFVEYITVEVDAEGQAVFHPDVYRYDRYFRRGRRPPSVVRYGSKSLRPKAVPELPLAEYRRLKAEGGKAPLAEETP